MPKNVKRLGSNFGAFELPLNPDEYVEGTRTYMVCKKGAKYGRYSQLCTKLELSLRPPLDFKVTLNSKKVTRLTKKIILL